MKVSLALDDLTRYSGDVVVEKGVRPGAHWKPEIRRFNEPFGGSDCSRFAKIPETDTATFVQGSGVEEDLDRFVCGRDAGTVVVVNAVLPLAGDLVAVRSLCGYFDWR